MPVMLFADIGFVMWLVFSERLSADTVVAGLGVVAALTFFLYRFGMWNPARDKLFLARIIPFIAFMFNLVIEVCKANIHMIGIVLSDDPDACISPRIVAHKTKLKTSKGRVALSSSITLTPGTVTVDVGDDCVYVHAIDVRSREGLNNSALERRLLRMEEGLR
ncbi:MAG: Na+/H+ antiporter subunit E [Fretibacterium sp.]|nr:Na+/H+ antiporter subunit E [Fretibacterium sp.]